MTNTTKVESKMYSVLIPSNWVTPDGRLVLRLIDRRTRKVKSLKIIHGEQHIIRRDDLPTSNPGDVIAWIDFTSGTETVALTERVNLASLKRAHLLREYFFRPKLTPAQNNEVESLIKIVNALRWITVENSNNEFKFSHRIMNDYGKITKNGKDIINRTFDSLNSFQDINDGSELSNQIAYLWAMLRITEIASKKLGTSETFDARQAKDRNSNQRTVAVEILTELEKFSRLPAVLALAASAESLISERIQFSEKFATLRHGQTAQSILQTGGLAGVYSVGTLTNIAPVPTLRINHPGIGADLMLRANKNRVTIIYSANPKFLKSYLFRIIFYMSAFPEYDYHFHLVAKDAECREMAICLLETFELNQKIREKDTDTSHVSFSFSQVPQEVNEDISYFASARYLIALEVMDMTQSPIWIQDVDLFPTGDTTPYIKTLRQYDISIFVSSFLRGILPWARYLAGNVFVNNTDMGREFLVHTSDYLTRWVTCPNNWTVDQNALAYAIDSCGEGLKIGNLRMMQMPVIQSKFAARIES